MLISPKLLTVATVSGSDGSVSVSGQLLGKRNAFCSYFTLAFASAESENQLKFKLSLFAMPTLYPVVKVTMIHQLLATGIYGLGEQYSWVNLRGKAAFPMIVREDGIISTTFRFKIFLLNSNCVFIGRPGIVQKLLNWFGNQAGSDETSTYYPSPIYITNTGIGYMLDNSEFSVFDLFRNDQVRVEVDFQSTLSQFDVVGRLFAATNPLELVSEITTITGRMKKLPLWTLDGVILGLQGGSKEVRARWAEAVKYNISIAAFWIQDWSGVRLQNTAGVMQRRLLWNWVPDKTLYPDWTKLIGQIRGKGIHVLSYINTFLADLKTLNVDSPENLFAEAQSLGYLIRKSRSENGTFMITSGPNFEAGVIDLFNPKAYAWLKNIIKTHVLDLGVSGFMADFAEYLPVDAMFSDSSRLASPADHNLYAVKWQQLTKEVMEEHPRSSELLVFHRSGFTKSPNTTQLFWNGDQSTTWLKSDGIGASLTGSLHMGITGASLTHSDVGGYTSFPLLFTRSKDLLYRWAELNVFSPLFRTHEGSLPDVNSQFYNSEETWLFLKYCADFFRSFKAYKLTVMDEVQEKGYPFWRFLWLHFPSDPNTYNLEGHFLLGAHVLIRPVVRPNMCKTTTYLPAGTWTHLWTNQTLVATSSGLSVLFDVPYGKPSVFLRHPIPETLNPVLDFAKEWRDRDFKKSPQLLQHYKNDKHKHKKTKKPKKPKHKHADQTRMYFLKEKSA